MRQLLTILVIFILVTGCTCPSRQADAYGHFEVTEVNVYAEQNGQIVYLSIEEGMSVKKGWLAGIIDTTGIVIQIGQMTEKQKSLTLQQSNLIKQNEVLKEQKRNLLREINRLENLLKENAATGKQIDDAKGQLNVLNLQIEQQNILQQQAEAELSALQKQKELLRYHLSKCYITCPIDGVILDKYIEQGESVIAGKIIFKIADIKKMFIRVYISQSQLTTVRIGQKVTVATDTGNGNLVRFPGIISWISEQAEFTPKVVQTREERINLVYAMKIQISNDGTLKAGMPGEVYFTKGGK